MGPKVQISEQNTKEKCDFFLVFSSESAFIRGERHEYVNKIKIIMEKIW